jgi:hypothetical protein|tara:strand:+ start:4304 stop:5128 length:825 start_codon:yes stop_codon:yes gene_type:complete
MKIKMRHNKKRNTAFIYEALISELTKCSLSKNEKKRAAIVSLIKEHFKKGAALNKELAAYSIILESKGLEKDMATRLVAEARRVHSRLDREEVFTKQTKLISEINKEIGKETFNNFVGNYKSMATISQMFSETTPIKKVVLLEQKLIDSISKTDEGLEEVKHIDNLVYRTFAEKFNEKYTSSLLEEQKNLLGHYIASFSDNSVELKLYLNEEISRLKVVVRASSTDEDLVSDSDMKEKINEVVSRLDGYRDTPIDASMIQEVLKIQSLAKEIQT